MCVLILLPGRIIMHLLVACSLLSQFFIGNAVSADGAPRWRTREVLIVAGNFSLDKQLLNMAAFDVETGEWSVEANTDLYLYGESNGVIWDIAVNCTEDDLFNNMYVVGAFDTASEASQIQYCSVGGWNGNDFDKVGEGLCPRGIDSSTAIRIQTVELGARGDLFVGGSFESRVWDGKHFVNVYHVAHFDYEKNSWLPLGGQLRHADDRPAKVETLAWDSAHETLFLGGSFEYIDDDEISVGLAMWTEMTGLISLPGGGVADANEGSKVSIHSIKYDHSSESLFVTGDFHKVGKEACKNVAVWYRRDHKWTCLYDPTHSISGVTAMYLDKTDLYISGWASATSSWAGTSYHANYAIAQLDVQGYITQRNRGSGGETGGGQDGNHTKPDDDDDDDDVKYYPTRAPTVHLPSTPHHTGHDNDDGGYDDDSIDKPQKSNKTKASPEPLYRPTDSPNKQPTKLKETPQPTDFADEILTKRPTTPRGTYRPTNFPEEVITRQPIKHRQNVGDLRPEDYLAIQRNLLRREHSHVHRMESRPSDDTKYEKNSTVHESEVDTNIDPSIVIHLPSSRKPTNNPTAAPTESSLWVPEWRWLPGFPGGNGPILGMTRGENGYRDTLFIVGAFNNYPAVVMWRENVSGTFETKALSTKHSLRGLVTTARQVKMAYLDLPVNMPSVSPPKKPKDYTVFILISCVLVGVVLGIMFAVGCYSSKYIKIEGQDDSDHEANGMMMSIPLKTLSGGASGIDFMHFFERAMKARHLSTRESSLLVINPNEIVLSRIIGEGSFGRVWSGQWRNNDVAVKEFVFAQAAIVGGSVDRHNVIEEIVGEAGIMACLRHPKILELYGCSLTMQAIWIVSELCVRGSLRMVLNDSNTELSFLKKISLALDIADGMIYLHRRSPPIIHRDLKSQNVFITEPSPGKLVAKIGDWGSARAVALTGSKSMTQGVGTACWLAPEVINCAHFSKASDVYAYGIVLWEIFSRQEVYEGLSAAQIIIKVAHEGLRPRVPKDCPWASLMTECWRQNASERPGFNRILQLLSSQYHNVKAATKRGVGEDHGHGNNDDMDEGSSYASVCSYDMSASMSDFRPGSRTSSDALAGDSATRSFTKGVPYMNVHQSGGTSSSGVQRGLGRGRYYQYPSRSGRRSNDGGTREDSDLTLGTGRESANINTLPSSSQAMPLPTASGRGGREGQSDNAQIPLLSQHPNSAATGAQLSDYGTDNSGR